MLKKFKQPRGKQEEEKGDIKTIMTKVKKQKGHKMGDWRPNIPIITLSGII